jgi:two-component system sensor kinase FixL
MYGYPAQEILGQPFERLVPVEERPEFEQALEATRAGVPTEPLDTVRLTRSGHRINVSVRISPVKDAGGRPVGVVSTARDLSGQRRAEQALRSSEARWRAIIESAVDAIILINRYGRIEFFNPAAERLFGFRAGQVMGQNITVLMPEPYASEHDHYLRRYLMTGERRIIGVGREVTARRSDGTVFPAHLSVAELMLDGETKFTGIVRDLTERVTLEKKLREESGLVRIGELAAVLAHEVKNPLAAVSGAIQMLSEHLQEPDDQVIIQEILRRLDGLGALMTDLLIYARPPRPRMMNLDVTELLHALVALLGSDPAWSELEVAIDGQTERVSADPELLKVAFQNLLLNAAQAMNGRGRLSISLNHADGTTTIDITDAGTGIPPEVRDRLFTPFFTTKARGTGLGLATVRRITEAHGGTVAVVRSGPEGTTVRVTLPSGTQPIPRLA